VLLVGFGALGWHIYTGKRAERQLREAGFVTDSEDWLGARVWAAARQDWRLVFNSRIWKSTPRWWRVTGAKAEELRNLDAVGRALRRVNPGQISITGCIALENVDGLKGLTGLQTLDLGFCRALQDVEGLKGVTGLQRLDLYGCSKIPASALRELRAALPKTDITFPDGSKLPPP